MQTTSVQAGDALYIPEGWWHQIDSVAGTIAVNIWWRSAFDRQLGGHMDAYYLRRALQSLTETHKAQLLKEPLHRASAAQGDDGDDAAGVVKRDKGLTRSVKRQRFIQDSDPTDPGGPHAILFRQQGLHCMSDWPRLPPVGAAIFGLL